MKRIWVYCKKEKCKELVEKTDKNGYICSNCNESLLDETPKDAPNFHMNPFARQTKMEISYANIEDNLKRFKKWVIKHK